MTWFTKNLLVNVTDITYTVLSHVYDIFSMITFKTSVLPVLPGR